MFPPLTLGPLSPLQVLGMDERSSITLYGILPALTVLLLVGRRIAQIGKRDNGLPPGPPTVPVLGNIHVHPLTDIHLQLVANMGLFVKFSLRCHLGTPNGPNVMGRFSR